MNKSQRKVLSSRAKQQKFEIKQEQRMSGEDYKEWYKELYKILPTSYTEWYKSVDADDAWIAQYYEQQQWEELEQAKQLSLPLGYVTQPTNKGESL